MNNEYLLQQKGKWLLFVPLLLLLSMGSKAQSQNTDSSKVSSITLNWGHRSVKAQDLLFSPLSYSGGAASGIGLTYTRETGNSTFFFGLETETVALESPSPLSFRLNGVATSGQSSELTGVRIAAGYVKPIKTNGPLKLRLGGSLSTAIDWIDLGLGLSEEESYLLATSIAPMIMGEYDLSEKSQLVFSAQLPLFSLTTRPTFAVVNNEEIQHDGSDLGFLYGESQFNTLDKYQAIDLQIRWVKKLSDSFDFSVGYRFDYARITEPETFSLRKNTIDLSISLKL